MQCTFDETIKYPDRGFTLTRCTNEAEIMVASDPCYGLCYSCAYKKLQAENERLKEALEFAKAEICTFSFQVEDTTEKGFALAEGINNKINQLSEP